MLFTEQHQGVAAIVVTLAHGPLKQHVLAIAKQMEDQITLNHFNHCCLVSKLSSTSYLTWLYHYGIKTNINNSS